jgi:2,3,4,5-tetrahydropyridine-2-carboxylate N-succinyltransferase
MGVFIGASTRIVGRTTGEMHHGRVPAYSVVVELAFPAECRQEAAGRVDLVAPDE